MSCNQGGGIDTTGSTATNVTMVELHAGEGVYIIMCPVVSSAYNYPVPQKRCAPFVYKQTIIVCALQEITERRVKRTCARPYLRIKVYMGSYSHRRLSPHTNKCSEPAISLRPVSACMPHTWIVISARTRRLLMSISP